MNIKICVNKTSLITVFILSFFMEVHSQPFTGQFTGVANGDSIVLDLTKSTTNQFSGTLKDSKQSYQISAVQKGNAIKGKAKETFLGITFDFEAIAKSKNQLSCILSMTIFGQTQADSFLLTKKGAAIKSNKSTPATETTTNKTNTKIAAALKGKAKDKQLVGTWYAQTVYNSGYGSDQFSGAVREGIVFTSNGLMLDAGSTVVMGGSNNGGSYGGASEGSGSNEQSVYWYTSNQQLYLLGLENGAVQTIHLGRYYIEGNKLLITGTGGKKKLYYKSN